MTMVGVPWRSAPQYGGQPPNHLGRFDRKDNIDREWVVRDIESGAEADLEHPTVQPVGDVGTHGGGYEQ
jgi:hypothetical protein